MLSVVIPVFDEQQSLALLHEELAEVAAEHGYELDVVLVDDGSTDGSWQAIRRLAAEDPRVRGIRFRRNFGKAAALSAGFRAAKGKLILTLDADLQDDPHEIPRFLAEIEKDLDVVSGWKKVRHDPWHKVYPSRVFNWLVSWVTGVKLHDHNCGMKCYRRDVFDEVRLYGELHRFVPVLAAAKGFRVGEVEVRHRPRRFGRSKYGVTRIVKGFLDLMTVKFLTGFSQRPQHVLGTVGLASFLLGIAFSAYLMVDSIIGLWSPEAGSILLRHGPAPIYAVGLLLLGGQLMSVGFLAELILAYQGRDLKTYSIAERTEAQATADETEPCPEERR
jgi:dolichol-phosphate mannosyltransferase